MEDYTPEEAQRLREINTAFLNEDYSRANELFQLVDRNNDGKINTAEFKHMMDLFEERPVSEEEANYAIKVFDRDCNGVIDINEFISYFEKRKEPPEDG
ncbi:hypothetical protein SteCoe_23339 [Stentor coeruleus]|uniref:EF-hand domain-containing protein n=1 Tax=Stentor coeruleus TaxID=5963 RepID=A0A1R2BKH2_9CILI|nr:hypothetical protein SteCoe_23339 [Stentor coeruleus]